jgi:DNA-binding response OmpR family regulator
MPDPPKKKFLIVDDEEEITSYLKDFFELRGFSVFTAAASKQAQDLILAERPPLILLDMNLSEKQEGLEVLKWMKSEGLSAKVIIASGDEDRAGIEEALRLGAVQHMRKPYSLEALLDYLRKLEI